MGKKKVDLQRTFEEILSKFPPTSRKNINQAFQGIHDYTKMDYEAFVNIYTSRKSAQEMIESISPPNKNKKEPLLSR